MHNMASTLSCPCPAQSWKLSATNDSEVYCRGGAFVGPRSFSCVDKRRKIKRIVSMMGSLVGADELPLLHKRIMITAPRQYASKLASLFLAAGARPVWVPAIEISALPEAECHQLDQLLSDLGAFTHIAFTSKNGIHAVLQRLSLIHGGMDQAVQRVEETGISLSALGADGEELKAAGFNVDVQPAEASTLGLVHELIKRNEARGSAILCPVPSVRGGLNEPHVIPRFIAALEEAGAQPTRVDSYVTQTGCHPEDCKPERVLLQTGEIHAIAFSSTAEAEGLVHAMGSVEAIQTAVQEHNILLAAHGPYTAEGVEAVLAIPVTCISQNFRTFDGLVTAVAAAL